MATITKRGGSYRIKVSCGYDINGKQMVQTKTWKPDEGMTAKQIKKEVQRQAVLFEESCKIGQITASVKFEAFAEQWFEEYAKLNLRSSTYEKMKQLPKRVYPAIGHLRLDKITGRHIQQFIHDLALNGKNIINGNSLSRKTIIHHLNFISDVFSYAIKMDMLSDNPCRNVTVPKGESKEKEIYTIDELARIFELLDSDDVPIKFRAFFKLAVYSGFRRGELLGLEWKDIDWENNLISVRRTSNYTADRDTYTDTTKTKKSKRTLKFPDYVMNMLRELKEEQDKEQNKLGNKWTYTDRLFTQWDGKPMGNNSPYYLVKRFCKRNNLRFCDLHSLRHLHASLLINAGVDVVAVSGDMGHSCVGTTSNIYCHMFQEARAKNSEVIAAALNFDAR
ncbi:MAG: site-specific integrase [Oscillospiraceae bacterium]|nr:site-specific integrase [Oscillospiraceae bacterium]